MSKFIYAVLIMSVLLPFVVSANGGDQRIADGYLVNLSRAPFTPVAGVKTALLASFVDLKTEQLIKEDTLVSIRITEGRGSRTFVHEKKDIPVQGGVLEYSYTFQNSGMHEIFFDFKFVNDPTQKIHELPDFLIDVQKSESTEKRAPPYLFVILGGVFGLIAGVALCRLFWGRSE